MHTSGGHHRSFVAGGDTKLGTVDHPLPLDEDQQLKVVVRPHDQSATAPEARVFLPAGFLRNMRKGMTVKLAYVDGSPQLNLVHGHMFNQDAPPSVYADPLPYDQPGGPAGDGAPLFVNIDDMIVYHDETCAYIRWRNQGSSASTAGPDGSPCLFDIQFLSGLGIEVSEYIPPGYPPPPVTTTDPTTGQTTTTTPTPPPPTRAMLSITMPQGQSIVLDEPSDGDSTFTYTHPSGATASVDTDGNWTFSSPGKIVLQAPDVEVGDDTGEDSANLLAFKDDVQNLVDYINTHVHTGVTTGSGTSGETPDDAPDPIGTVNTHAV